jgi:hypothetical protein
MGRGNGYGTGSHQRILEFDRQDFLEALMRILVSAASMVRMVVLCFMLGIVLGVYFGVAGSPSAVPPAEHSVDHSVDSVNPVNAKAP